MSVRLSGICLLNIGNHGAKIIYAALGVVSRAGNMMIGVVIKDDGTTPTRLVSH